MPTVESERLSWKIGNVRVHRIVERDVVAPLSGLVVGVPGDVVDRYPWLLPHFVTPSGDTRISFHGLVIDTGALRILVDTCLGPRQVGRLPAIDNPFLGELSAAGYEVGDIDVVLCTHLHFDHVGWNTQLVDGNWEVTFPNARYLFGRIEWEHWSTTSGRHTNIDDTVRPVVDAGQADLVELDHRVCDEVRLVPSPGHTPGHACVVIESGGQRAVITGDLAHHPVQFGDPAIYSAADSDSVQSAETRRAFLADRAADGAVVIGTHFASPTAGWVRRDGDHWKFDVDPGDGCR